LARHRSELDHKATVVRMASPEEVLRRGFAILRSDGRILADTSGLEPGMTLEVETHDATLTTTLINKTLRHG
jgi:exodeoxyribonuclease VII large subunit